MANATPGWLTAFVGATVIDGSGAAPLRDATIVVDERGVIDEVSQRTEFPREVRVIDVSGRTVIPGIVDAHVHLASWAQWLITRQHESLMFLAAQTVNAMRKTLEHGVTTARDLGGLESGFVLGQASGLLPGPRLQTSVVIIHPTGGITDYVPGFGGATSPQGLFTSVPGVPAPYADGPDDVRRKVREVLRAGADVIKVAACGAAMHHNNKGLAPSYTPQELRALVDESHGKGVMVTCHASGPAVKTAIDAGVDTIEHGNVLDDESISAMADRGTWLIPLFWPIHLHNKHSDHLPGRNAADVLATKIDAFQRARRAGVRIAMGSDSGHHGIGGSTVELQYLVDAGCTPLEAITMATQRSAEVMGLDREIGTIAKGKNADLVVVDGDPLVDITVLRAIDRIDLVVQRGRLVAGARVRPDALVQESSQQRQLVNA